MQHSVLIVTDKEAFETVVRRSLPEKEYMGIETRGSASSARRALLDRYFDLVLINVPLPDENGVELALDTAENQDACVLLVVPQDRVSDVTERVVDSGVLVAGRPLPRGGMGRLLRFLIAIREKTDRVREKLEKAEERYEELKLVTKAKLLLMEKKGLTEEEAHHLIQKTAMDNGRSRRRTAEEIIEELE